MLPTTATLAYSTPVGNIPVSSVRMAALMGAVALYQPSGLPNSTDPVINGLFGSTITSDVTALAGSNMVRTIVITLGPTFFVLFPTVADWTHALDNFYTHALSLALSVQVTAAAVVFA